MSASISFIFVLVLVPLVAGVILLAFSKRGRLGFPSCGSCGYNVSGTIGTATRCPECGAEFLKVGIAPPRSPRNPAFLWLGLALVLLPLTCFGSMATLALMHERRNVASQQAARQAAAQAVAAQLQAQAAQSQPATASTQPDADNTSESGTKTDAP